MRNQIKKTLLMVLLFGWMQKTRAFAPVVPPRATKQQLTGGQRTVLRFRDHDDDDFNTTATFGTKDISKMKNSEMRKELESYGVSTKSFLEKKEFVEALEQARREDKKPSDNTEKRKSTRTKKKEHTAGTRKGRYDKALQYAKGMKVSNLKQALKDRGISTKSFLERSEFEKAYAHAVADHVETKKTSGSKQNKQEEPYDPSYRDVMTQRMDPRMLVGQRVIDI